MSRTRWLPAVALAILATGLASPAGAACRGGRFVVQGPTAPIVTPAVPLATTTDRIVVAKGQLDLLSLGDCPPTLVRVASLKRGARVRARWNHCPAVTGIVRLQARIDAACGVMKGTVVDRKMRLRKKFTAVASHCGDGFADAGAGEECEPPSTISCDEHCKLVSADGASCPGADLQNDPLNCGACGAACTGVNGSATCSSGKCLLDCASGFSDCDDVGANGCETQGTCNQCTNPAQSLCRGSCVNKQTDTRNCGTCGRHCFPGEVCGGGRCSCPTGNNLCGGRCVDLLTDAKNCGFCGLACGKFEVCNGGSCLCPPENTSCGGVCSDLVTDPAHCGECGITCLPGESCEFGKCACVDPKVTCAGRCVDRDTDPANCGRCGDACIRGDVCIGGKCVCPDGHDVCNGACVDFDTDPKNCGRCGGSCLTGDLCVFGRCLCADGKTECSGRCVDTETDAANCGRCGDACITGERCVLGQCDCPADKAVCGNVCTDLRSDAKHCGHCGTSCPTGKACVLGRCE